MIRIGLSNEQKIEILQRYVSEHQIKKIVCIDNDAPAEPAGSALKRAELLKAGKQGRKGCGEALDLSSLPCETETLGYDDAILYKYFYRLLEEINGDYLIVVNECLQDTNRNCLTYNCMHHYLNQTPHRVVFNFFPFINDAVDFMVLADKAEPGKYKAYKRQGNTRGYDPEVLDELDVQCVRHMPGLTVKTVELPADAHDAYECEKAALFDGIGNKDPNTIPRTLHLWCGRYKKEALLAEETYWARNARFNRPNVKSMTRPEPCEYARLVDCPSSHKALADFLRVTGATHIEFLSTGLGADNVYAADLQDWLGKLGEFYAQASLYR